MRIAALPGNRVHGFDIFGAEIVENFAHETDRLVFTQARFHGAVEFVVSNIDHHRRRVEQRDLVTRLDEARFRHERLAIDDFDSFFLQGEKDWQLNDVDAHRLFVQAAHFQLDADLLCDIFRASHFWRHRAA